MSAILFVLSLVAARATAPHSDSELETLHVFPVEAPHYSYSSEHHDYPATDIFCPVGSRFVAPVGGVVEYISAVDAWDPVQNRPETRGGISIALIGTDGWRYYGSHLSRIDRNIRVGTHVHTGQVLGFTGKSGDARFTPPHLHFGISHPTFPTDWRTRRGDTSPYPYLKAWEAAAKRARARIVH